MCDEFITAKHIEKIGHHIPEIRDRALLNIHSKLQRGILYDNDLARSKELFWQLFNWFRDNQATKQHDDIVLQILQRIIQSETGIFLIDLHGSSNLINEFNQLKNIVSDNCIGILQEILNYLETVGNNPVSNVIVPPLNLHELENSMSNISESQSVNVGTTATTIAGFVDSFISLDVADNNQQPASSKTYRVGNINNIESPFKYFTFLWQWLIGADRHVLESVEDTLRNPSEPSALINSCEFFTDVLLHDFPAEVFLQRPGIVKQLHDLLWSNPSSRITTAILKCLVKLTKEFINRIRFYDNPGTHNLKLNNFHIEGSPREAETCTNSPEEENDESFSTDVEDINETINLMKNQMNVPQYCLNTINSVFDYLYVTPEAGDSFKRKKCLIGCNFALVLLRDAVSLLKLTVKCSIWTVESQKYPNVETILKKFQETFRKFGEVLQHFRIKVLSDDFNEETRLIQLHLILTFIHLYEDFIPVDKSMEILPVNLKHVLSETLLDAPLNRLFPFLHHKLIDLTKSFQCHDSYEDVTRVCDSMTAAIKFLREWKALPFTKNIALMDDALGSLEFHKNMKQITIFIELCANKLTMHSFDDAILTQIEDILLKLLTHYEEDIRVEVYKLCQHKVIKTIGAKSNVSKSSIPGSQILFLLRGRILQCIAMHGLHDSNEDIQRFSEDILIHVLKAKLLVNDEIWQETVTALMPTMPVLLTHANDQKSLIGRHVLSLLDPDRSRLMNFANVEVLRLNVGMLFVKNSDVRMEAVSRLCWLLSSCNNTDNTMKMLLPHLNNLHDKALSNVCQIERKIDFKSYRGGQAHFYQPSSLHQVIELLSSGNLEPVIRRSAVSQISVMMDDPLLHSTLLESNGLEIIKGIMLSALTDNDYQVYPDSVIPCLSILKNLCLYNATVRQELANSEEYFNYILRGVFMYCAEPRVKTDCAILLFLIVFNEYIKGSPVKNDLSLPEILQKALNCPFESKTYSDGKGYTLESLTKIKENKWSLASVQIHWNIEWFQGLEKLLQPELTYAKSDEFSNILKLTSTDLRALKSTSIEHLLQKCLNTIYESHVHEQIVLNLHIITRCLNLYELVQLNSDLNIESFEWEKSFERYLNAPPAGQQDNILLSHIFDLLTLLIPLLRPTSNEVILWITSLITDKNHYIYTILSVDLSSDQEPDVEKLLNSLLQLINACTITEQSLLTDSSSQIPKNSNRYSFLVKTLINNLQCNNAKHFYNLAYLDRLLTTLTHLTATFGWSGSKSGEEPKKVLKKLAISALELLNAFHCGKGPTAADSLMGLSITKNVILVLNHLVAEMQHFHVKQWEDCFSLYDGESAYLSVFILKNGRDVVLRAAAVHLLSGFAMSLNAAIQMTQDISKGRDYLHLWKTTLGILCDHEESSIVRENAALLLTNLSSYVTHSSEQNTNFAQGILTKIQKAESNFESQKKVLIALLDACNFFAELETLLKCLRTEKVYNLHEIRQQANTGNDLDDFMFVYNKVLEVSTISDSLNCNGNKGNKQFETIYSLTTPGLVKAVSTFVHNLLHLLPEFTCKQLLAMGLIKLLFKCIMLPNIEIEHTRDLMFYADILQMNTAICNLLAKTAHIDDNCLLTIGNARDCLNVLTSLLDPSVFVISLPELQYLRNQLWSSIFTLLDVLLRSGKDDNMSIKQKYDTSALILQLETRKNAFLLSLCESISSDLSTDLQLSALNSLASLLKSNEHAPECDADANENKENEDTLQSSPHLCSQRESSRSSVQTLLDNTKTPRLSSRNSPTVHNTTNKLDVLKEVYFRSPTSSMSLTSNEKSTLSISSLDDDQDTTRMAGAELCKILLDLYEALNLQKQSTNRKMKRKTVVMNTLTGLLLVSNEAKQFALENGLLPKIIDQLKTIYVQLSLENVDCLRRSSDKKRLNPVLQELEGLIGLTMNFIYGCEQVKHAAGQYGLADVIHKLWLWLLAQKHLHLLGLRLLCTLTSSCPSAAATLALTTSVAGAGPRKNPGNNSLLHVICGLITKEMELISKTHCLKTLQFCFDILHNCVIVTECRFIVVKSNFLASFGKLHPAMTKRQKPWEQVEFLWLEFLHAFSSFSEGQTTIGKTQDVFEIVLCLCGCPNVKNRREALETLRNIAFHQTNRARLLASDDFLNIVLARLTAAIPEEVMIIVSAIWALAANCQKAKMTFKAARIDQKINDFLRISYLSNFESINEEDTETLKYVLSLITQS